MLSFTFNSIKHNISIIKYLFLFSLSCVHLPKQWQQCLNLEESPTLWQCICSPFTTASRETKTQQDLIERFYLLNLQLVRQSVKTLWVINTKWFLTDQQAEIRETSLQAYIRGCTACGSYREGTNTCDVVSSMKTLCAAAVWVGLSHHQMFNRTDQKKILIHKRKCDAFWEHPVIVYWYFSVGDWLLLSLALFFPIHQTQTLAWTQTVWCRLPPYRCHHRKLLSTPYLERVVAWIINIDVADFRSWPFALCPVW